MNAGFEDISILYEMMNDMEKIGRWFSEYEKSRKPTMLMQLLNHRNFLK
jgi:hypothetical protein